MKLIEKLAIEHTTGWSNAASGAIGYEAGFRKALELAADACEQLGIRSDSHTFHTVTRECQAAIRALADQEAE